MSVGLGQDPVTLTCRVRGENIFLRVDGDLFDHNTITDFRERGITFSNAQEVNGVITQSVTVTLSVENNNTEVICHASFSGSVKNSSPATIYIAGMNLYTIARDELK